MYTSYDQIRTSVISIIQSITKRPSVSLTTDKDESLLSGEPFFLSAVELVYLFFELEDHFDIRFSDEDVKTKKFSTIREIIDLIIKEKSKSDVA